MEQQICLEADAYNQIVFGPFIGELGWEIFRWSGWVRWYKENRPEKEVIVFTRESRSDLYEGCVNAIEVFQIEGDYLKYQPDCYDCTMPSNMYEFLINSVKDKYPKAIIFEPRKFKTNKGVFDSSHSNYAYTPNPANDKMIEDLILTSKDKERIPIVLSSRERKDMAFRNWGNHNWKNLINMLENSDNFIVFVAGQSPSYFRAESKRYMFNLEDFVSSETQTTLIGLTIAAIKRSKLTIGPQTANIILSNLLKTPTLFWGHEIRRHAEKENPYKTVSRGLLDRNYSIDPIIIFREIVKLAK
jgi:hypothetical protein